ncbi:MAG TPA: MraY family glycosyltransferase [Phycisphaerae bacterium]|nr:MraY family glycosyltransferase [Phycisphaerae bacterium]
MSGESLILGLTWAACRQTIEQVWPIAAISLGVSLLATPFCRRIALKKNIVDRPDEFLKPHERPIPYLGGVAVFAGWIAGLIVAILWARLEVRTTTMLAVAAAGLAIMLIGLFDDLRVMRPTIKLVCNIGVAVWLLYFGIGDRIIQVATHFLVGPGENLERWVELAYSVPITLFIIVGACNATNLIDGLDGLCAGVLGIIALGFFILAVNLRESAHLLDMIANERIVFALAMLGAAVGFLPFNRNPAKIFLGDAGSMLLGLNVAILILLFAEAHLVRWMIGSLMVFGLPLTDMCLTLARRWRNGRPLMQGDRSHFYDQLRDRGMSVRRVVAISYLLTLAFVLVGVSAIFLRTRHAILVYALAVMAVVAALWKFNMVGIERDRRSQTDRPGSPHHE